MSRILVLLLMVSTYALASEAGHGETDIVQRTVNFLLFAGLIWYLVAEPAKNYFASRSKTIADELNKVQEKLKESVELKKEALAKISEAEKFAEELAAASKKENKIVNDTIMAQCDSDLEVIAKQHDTKKDFETRNMVVEVVENVISETLEQSSEVFDREAMANVIFEEGGIVDGRIDRKRYVKALKETTDAASMEAISGVFDALADSFKDDKFVNIVANPDVSLEDKSTILLEAVKPANSKELDNFVKLLVQNRRIQIIPAVSVELKKDIANTTKTYEGTVYSDSDLNEKVISDLSDGLSKKFDSTITLNFVKNDFNGIKVAVDGLGIEINFSKDRIDSQIIQHIIKAI